MVQSQQVLEWQAEARKEGEAHGQAKSILRLLERRIGAAVPANLAAQVRAVTDPAILDHWFDVADSVTTFKEFRRRIKE